MAEPRTRRRGHRLEQAILDAAWAELEEVGYGGLTIEGVAARAATSKPVIYRRWPNRAALVLAAWGRRVPLEHCDAETGTLRGDLIALFAMVARKVDSMMGELIAGVMGEAFRDPDVTALLQERLRAAPLMNTISAIVERAVRRGELPPTELTPRASRLPLELVRNERMMCGAPVDDETIAQLVDDVYLPLLRGLAR